MQTTTVISGHLTDSPELRFTGQGTAVANLTITHNTRRFDEPSGAWVDGKTTFLRATVWGRHGENVAEHELVAGACGVQGLVELGAPREGDQHPEAQHDARPAHIADPACPRLYLEPPDTVTKVRTRVA